MIQNCFVGSSLETTHDFIEEDFSELIFDNLVDGSLEVTIATFEDGSSKFIHGSIRDCSSLLTNGAFEDSLLEQLVTQCEDGTLSSVYGTHGGVFEEELSS